MRRFGRAFTAEPNDAGRLRRAGLALGAEGAASYSFALFERIETRGERVRDICTKSAIFQAFAENRSTKWLRRAVASMSEKVMFVFRLDQGDGSGNDNLPARKFLMNKTTTKEYAHKPISGALITAFWVRH